MKTKISCLFLICTLFVSVFASVDVVHAATYGDLTYNVSDGCVKITGCSTSVSGALEIPAMIDGYPVTSIGYQAFFACDGLTSITILDSVTDIGSYAFSRCTKLTNVTLPDSITTIDNYAFENCTSLTSITIPSSVTFLGDWAFEGCTSLESITIPDSVTGIYPSVFAGTAYYNNEANWENDALYIGNHLIKVRNTISGEYIVKNGTKSIVGGAFSFCSSLTDIIIPVGVISIGDYAFEGCSSLTVITIPDGVTSIGDFAFSGCSNLTSITILDSVITIGHDAFAYCNNLTSITIPDSVTAIDGSVFYECSNLTSITISNSVTEIHGNAFYGCSNLIDVYYTGSEEDWADISIMDYGNEHFTNATIHYNYTANTSPDLYGAYNDSDKTVTITSDTAYADVTVLVASYQSGKLVSMQSKPADLSIGDTDLPFEELITTNADTVKVMIWGSKSDLNPLGKVCAFPL